MKLLKTERKYSIYPQKEKEDKEKIQNIPLVNR